MGKTLEAWERHWDVIVVGTGMGGATLGLGLVKRGHSVLFLERGGDRRWDKPVMPPWSSDDEFERSAHGMWPRRLSHLSEGRIRRFHAPLGSGVGGSTLFYAAALERLEPLDFDGAQVAGRNVPAWPVRYADMAPYYSEAEQLFRAKRDDATAISAWDRRLMTHLGGKGLEPVRLQVGMNYDAQCRECLGTLCARRCKADARTICIEPALSRGNGHLLTDCEVTHLEAGAERVEAVHAVHRGRRQRLTARLVVLAAGAYFSPTVLLRSRSQAWPRGLANRSGLVGRHLMFHVSDMLAVWAPWRLNRKAPCRKSMMVRDFYVHQGERLGTFQSMGFDTGREVIEQHLQLRLQHLPLGSTRWAQRMARVPAAVATRIFGSAGLFATITEDFPDADNRVVLDDAEPSGMHFAYRIPAELTRRVLAFRAKLKQALSPWWMLPLSATAQPNFGHPSGTCRFGDDPATSVLDRHNRAHGVRNLYVVDASFMPTSGAVNPSLTIAANALRIAPIIDAAFRSARI